MKWKLERWFENVVDDDFGDGEQLVGKLRRFVDGVYREFRAELRDL